MIFCKLCVDEDQACCDFCKFYDFNGNDGMYSGEGYCYQHAANRDPEEMCNYFQCKDSINEL